MAGREVREYTNLSDARDKKWGSKLGKDKIDDEDLAFKRMVAKIVLWGGTTTALDSDDLLYLKEQMEAEEDAERLRRRTEKRAFAAFKKAASLVDALPLPVLQPHRVEPKPHTGIRQQVLVKSIVEVKPKRHRISGPTDGTAGMHIRSSISNPSGEVQGRDMDSTATKVSHDQLAEELTNASGILGLAYGTSDDEEESDPGHERRAGEDISVQSTVVSNSSRCGHECPFPADRSLL